MPERHALIVCVHLLNDFSGSPRVLAASIRALSRREQVQLYVGSSGPGVLDAVEALVIRYPYRRSRRRLVTLFRYLGSQVALLVSLARAKDVPKDAVVWVNTLLPFGAILWGRLTGRKVVVHVHEVSITPVPLRWFLTAVARACSSALIYVSQDHRTRLPICPEISSVISNPIDEDVVDRARLPTLRKAGTFACLMLASPREYKGLEELRMLAAALSGRPDITLDLVLNCTEQEAEAYRRRCGKVPNLRVHGAVENPGNYYRQAHLVMNLSRVDQWIETFGLTLVEGMAHGLPVIGPPVGGPAEVISHGVDGFCIDSRDTRALCDAITLLADDPPLHLRMGHAAHRRAREFSSAAFRAKVYRLVDGLREDAQA